MRYIDDDDEALSQIRKNKNLRGMKKRKRKRKRKKNSRALHAFLYSVLKVKRRTTFHSRDLVRTVGGFQIVLNGQTWRLLKLSYSDSVFLLGNVSTVEGWIWEMKEMDGWDWLFFELGRKILRLKLMDFGTKWLLN